MVVLVAGLGGAAQASGARTPTSPGRVESNGAIAAASALRFVAVAPQADTSTEVGQSVAAGEVSYIVADASPTRVAFLRFDLSSLRGPMASGVLRLHVSQDPTVVGSDSDSGGSVYAVGNGVWSELTTTAATQPAIDGLRGDTVGPVVAGQWVEFDVSRLTREGGIVSLAIVSTSVDGVRYDSRESKDFAPELRVAVGWPARLPAGSMVVAAVGDLACPASTARSSAECHQRDVSDAIIRDPEVSAFFALGDLQYPGGALADFQTGYEASFGRFKDITYPAVGNHEYITPGATGYFSYFGASAGDPSRGYYSFDLGTSWHVVSLNSNCTVVSCSAGSAQEQWLRADLAATARPCTILMWHHPRFSSSSVHGNDPAGRADVAGSGRRPRRPGADRPRSHLRAIRRAEQRRHAQPDRPVGVRRRLRRAQSVSVRRAGDQQRGACRQRVRIPAAGAEPWLLQLAVPHGGPQRPRQRRTRLLVLNDRYAPRMVASPYIHETAVVEDGSDIGQGTSIWHHAHVRSGASIGAGCVIGKNVYVDEGVRIGSGCKVQNNVSVYNGVTIGDDVFVGPSATFTNDRVPRAFNHGWQIMPTVVGEGASLGANCTIVCGVTIGRFAMVAAGATVTRDVADHQLVGGTPARHLGWVDRDGNVVSRAVEAPKA